jgi:hypothetical protein
MFVRKAIKYLLEGMLAGSLMLSQACQKAPGYQEYLESNPIEYTLKSAEQDKKGPSEDATEGQAVDATGKKREIKIEEIKTCLNYSKQGRCDKDEKLQAGKPFYVTAKAETSGLENETLEGAVKKGERVLAKAEEKVGGGGKSYLNFAVLSKDNDTSGKTNLEIIIGSNKYVLQQTRKFEVQVEEEKKTKFKEAQADEEKMKVTLQLCESAEPYKNRIGFKCIKPKSQFYRGDVFNMIVRVITPTKEERIILERRYILKGGNGTTNYDSYNDNLGREKFRIELVSTKKTENIFHQDMIYTSEYEPGDYRLTVWVNNPLINQREGASAKFVLKPAE